MAQFVFGPDPLLRLGRKPIAFGTGGSWFNAPVYADMAAVADFNNDRYAITTVPLGSIPTATAAELCAKRSATFDELFAYLCSSSGTARWREAENGLLVSDSQVDRPRLDWQNGKRQLLNEAATQNLLLYSDSLTTSPWKNEGPAMVTTAGAGISPTGNNDAFLLDDQGAASVNGRQQDVTIANDSSVYVASCFMKAGTSSVASLRIVLNGGTSIIGEAVINLANGQAQWRSANVGTSFKVEAFPNGWYRLTVCVTNNTTGNTTAAMIIRPAFAPNYTTSLDQTAVGGILAWGADLKIDASGQPSTHVSTGASSVTRAVESCRLSPVLEAIMQRASFGVSVRGQNLLKNGARIIGVSGTAIVLRTQSNRLAVLTDSPSQLSTATGSDTRSNAWAASCGIDGAGRSVARNGLPVVTDMVVSTISRTNVFLGRDGGGAAAAFGDGWFDSMAILPARPSDARLAELVA